MTGKNAGAPGLSAAVRQWLIREAKWGPPSTEDAVRSALGARNLACPKPLLDFECGLHALVGRVEAAAEEPVPIVLALAGHNFGILRALSRAHVAALEHEGKRLICVALGPQGDLYMASDGALFRRAAERSGPVALAYTATAYLQRLVRIAMLAEPLRFELAGRDTAAALAEALELPADLAASDGLQRLWGDDDLLLFQGEFHDPGRAVCHAYASLQGAARLVEAAQALGARGAFLERLFASNWQQTLVPPQERAELGPEPAHHFEYKPLVGRGGGFIAHVPGDEQGPSGVRSPEALSSGALSTDGATQACIEQVCIVDGDVVERLRWPERSCVKMMAGAKVEGLSASGHERMARLGIYRDPRLIAEPEALRERLAEAGLPAHELVFELERLMGGLRRLNPHPMGALHFGCHALLVGSAEAEHQWDWVDESEDLDGVWPRLSYRDEPVVPVGGGLETIILAGDGRLWRYDMLGDEVCPLPSGPLVVLESELMAQTAVELRNRGGGRGLAWQLNAGPEPALVANALALSPVSYATEGIFRWWQASDESAYLRADEVGAWLVAPPAVVAEVRERFLGG